MMTLAANFAAWGLLGAFACAAEEGADSNDRRGGKNAPVHVAQLTARAGHGPTSVGAANPRLQHLRPSYSGLSGQTGMASVYGGDRHRGSKTASGERVYPGQLTAAHRSLPFGTRVRVTNIHNGHSVVVRINDRGPFARGRIIDVTPAAARILGFAGLARVSLSVAEAGN